MTVATEPLPNDADLDLTPKEKKGGLFGCCMPKQASADKEEEKGRLAERERHEWFLAGPLTIFQNLIRHETSICQSLATRQHNPHHLGEIVIIMV